MTTSIQKQTFSGILWGFLENSSLQIFGFIQGVILARLLMPADYGLVAMTGVFFAISGTLIDGGFSNALIRKKNCREIDYSTVFVINVGMSSALSILLCISSSIIADFYHEPLLKKIVQINALLMFLNSFITIQNVRLSCELNFKPKSIINFAAVVCTGLATIALAFMGYGVWALIYPGFLTIIVRALLFFYYQRWFPKIQFSKNVFKELFSFGSNLMFSSLLNTVYGNLYPLIIGRAFTSTDLGIYSKANGYASLPATTVTGILTRVTYPVLSKLQDDSSRLESVYRKMLRVSAFVVFPILIGLAVLARPLVITLITSKWEASIPLLQILCLSAMWYPIHALNVNVLLVKGRSDLFLKIEIIKKVVGVLSICISFPFGIFWMCFASVVISIICLFINTYYTGKLLQLGIIKQFADLLPSITYSITMGFVMWLVTSIIDDLFCQLFIGVIVGILFYFGSAKITHSKDLKYMLEFVNNNIHK